MVILLSKIRFKIKINFIKKLIFIRKHDLEMDLNFGPNF